MLGGLKKHLINNINFLVPEYHSHIEEDIVSSSKSLFISKKFTFGYSL